MARNGTGTYSVVNTFVSGNVITASGHNQNWTDIAAEITNSVAADGQTTITAPLKHSNGAVGVPSITFASDLDSGFYRAAANSVALALGGADAVVWTSATATFTGSIVASGSITAAGGFISSATASFIFGLVASATAAFAGPALFSNGTNSLPAVSFISDPDSGFYRIGANNVGAAVNGAKVLDIATTGLSVTGALSSTTSITAGNGLTVTTGSVSLPAGSIAAAALNPAIAVPVLLATLTASNSATLADTTSLTATYKCYDIVFLNLIPATNAVICRFRVNVGGVQTTGYTGAALFGVSGTQVFENQTTYIACSRVNLANTGTGISGTLRIYDPAQTATPKTVTGNFAYKDTGGTPGTGFSVVAGSYDGSNSAVTGFQVDMSSGNITSGVIKVYGIP